ncbi:hypothetical protein [Bacteroides sp. Marseille-P3684]|uniref:hypothetical protein n=1 Tax=Bacteroides sp. Marseille-P3684 TaxID=2086579 RepID=UPI000D101B11|nr:hypothetical protein [Bacteroides sp. Marseille-P3684]
MKRLLFLLCMLSILLTDWSFAQDIKTVKQALDAVSFVEPPFSARKWTPFPYLGEFPINTVIPDNLYEDLQSTQYIHAYKNEDLYPSLYLKMRIPDSKYVLGAVTFGGATDYLNDQLFLADEKGNITDVLEGCTLNSNIAIKQYRIYEDLSITVSHLVVTKPAHITYHEYFTNEAPVRAYRMDELYQVKEGKFVKVGERPFPEKYYTYDQLYNLDIWAPGM